MYHNFRTTKLLCKFCANEKYITHKFNLLHKFHKFGLCMIEPFTFDRINQLSLLTIMCYAGFQINLQTSGTRG